MPDCSRCRKLKDKNRDLRHTVDLLRDRIAHLEGVVTVLADMDGKREEVAADEYARKRGRRHA